jgi:hypothetical protein
MRLRCGRLLLSSVVAKKHEKLCAVIYLQNFRKNNRLNEALGCNAVLPACESLCEG